MKSLRILSNSSLKIIAIVSMFIDHFGFAIAYHWPVLAPCYSLMRAVGRIAFPIFCFLLVEGFWHTSSRQRYCRNLFFFALLSELPFDLVFNAGRSIWHSQNVFFTLFIGLMVLWGLEYFRGKLYLQAVIILLGMGIAYLINCDYDWKGILLILIFYLFRSDSVVMTVAGCISLYWEWAAIFAFIPINMYNGQRGWMKTPVAKYAFYLFYPAHLLVLAWIRYHSGLLTLLPIW